MGALSLTPYMLGEPTTQPHQLMFLSVTRNRQAKEDVEPNATSLIIKALKEPLREPWCIGALGRSPKYMCVGIHMYMSYVCIYIYIYIDIDINIYIYIYLYVCI